MSTDVYKQEDTRVPKVVRHLMWCWEANSGPLTEQQALLTIEPSLHPPASSWKPHQCPLCSQRSLFGLPL